MVLMTLLMSSPLSAHMVGQIKDAKLPFINRRKAHM